MNNAVLGRTEYLQFKTKLNFERSYWVTFFVIAIDWGLIALAIKLLSVPGWVPFVLSQLVFAMVFFHSFGVLHECGHGTASSHRWLNTVTGLYASVLCFLPYFPWKSIHQRHHVWAGNSDRDPTARNLKTWQSQRRIPWLLRFAWRSWLPLAAFAQHVVFWSYPLVLMREDKRQLVRCWLSVALLPLCYVTLYLMWPSVFRPKNFALAFAIYLVASELVNMPHHADLFKFSEKLPLWEQWRAARSCYYPLGISELFVLNFNFHIEHHLFPSLPWYRLRHARKLIRPMLGREYNESVGIGWNVSNRSRDIQQLLLPDDADHRPA